MAVAYNLLAGLYQSVKQMVVTPRFSVGHLLDTAGVWTRMVLSCKEQESEACQSVLPRDVQVCTC